MNPEIIGMLGTIFIVTAFLQNGEEKIRRLDAIGAVLFITYGILTHTVSTVVLNSILFCVQLLKLRRLRRIREGKINL